MNIKMRINRLAYRFGRIIFKARISKYIDYIKRIAQVDLLNTAQTVDLTINLIDIFDAQKFIVQIITMSNDGCLFGKDFELIKIANDSSNNCSDNEIILESNFKDLRTILEKVYSQNIEFVAIYAWNEDMSLREFLKGINISHAFKVIGKEITNFILLSDPYESKINLWFSTQKYSFSEKLLLIKRIVRKAERDRHSRILEKLI